MRVVTKLTSLSLLTACLVLGVYGVVTVRREGRMFEATMTQDARLTGRALRAVVARVWTAEGPEAAAALLQQASQRDQKLEFDCLRLEGLAPADQRQLTEAGEVVRVSGPAIEVLLPIGPNPQGALRVRESLERERQYLRRSAAGIVTTTATLLVLSGLLSLLIGTRVVGRPMGRLIVKTRQIGQGDLSGALQLPQRDEIGELATAMNEMCRQLQEEIEHRREAQSQLRHAERLATVGQLASGIAHELGTPLNVVIGRGLLIAEDPEVSSQVEASARVVVQQAERMSTIVRQLLDFGRLGRRREERTDLSALVSDAASLLGPLARNRARVRLDAPEPAWVLGDPDQLLQVITNLVMNALEATPGEGEVTLRVQTTEATPPLPGARPGRYVQLEVADTGAGIPAEDRARVFEPFFTTKEVGEGTGLGLSVAHGVVLDHEGWIELDSEPSAGSRFVVYLPWADGGANP